MILPDGQKGLEVARFDTGSMLACPVVAEAAFRRPGIAPPATRSALTTARLWWH
jgi:hypothetical protein